MVPQIVARWKNWLCGLLLVAICASCDPKPPNIDHLSGPEIDQERIKKASDPEPKRIFFDSDAYLKNICASNLSSLSFKPFRSENLIYDSPLPVVVSGEYYEISWERGRYAHTVYDEIAGTLFRNLTIKVEAPVTAPYFLFDQWSVEYTISDFPFHPDRQLKYQRPMGVTFPMLDLASIDEIGADEDNLDVNVITVVNILRSGSSDIIRLGDEEKRVADLRFRATGTDYVRQAPIFDEIANAVRGKGRAVSISSWGEGYLFHTENRNGRPLVVVAVSKSHDMVGFRVCEDG